MYDAIRYIRECSIRVKCERLLHIKLLDVNFRMSNYDTVNIKTLLHSIKVSLQ